MNAIGINVCWAKAKINAIISACGLVGAAEQGHVVFYWSYGIEVLPVERITLCPNVPGSQELLQRLFDKAQGHLDLYVFDLRNPAFWPEPQNME